MIRCYLFLLITLLSSGAISGTKVHETTLDNGMQVIVKEDHRAPIVVSQVWYKVGSSYEHSGITGISHVLEHMMFKGTEVYGPGEFSRIIAANGGSENAFTGRDYTAYFQTLAKDRLEVALKLEADRMRNLRIASEEFAKEVEVVKEERRLRTEDKPQSLTFEKFSMAAFDVSPYRIPVIGWMNDLDELTVDDIRDWYERWYAPNNATLVVVGDVEPDEVFALARTHFGPLTPEKVVAPKPQQEPTQKGVKRIKVKVPAKQPYLLLGYKTPVVGSAAEDWEPYALEMLVSILDGGSSARISRNLIRGSQIAVSAGASYSAFRRLPGMLLLDGVPAGTHGIEELEGALLAEIDRLRSEPVDEGELERVRTQVVAGKVYELDSVFYQAMQIGKLETLGLDWRLLDQYVERMRAVTPAQVQAVARKYLNEDNLSIAVLEPLPLEPGVTKRRTSAGGRHGI